MTCEALKLPHRPSPQHLIEMFAQYAQEGKRWHKAAAVMEKPILPAGSNKGD
jgi:hypothetical protein